jgi:hypothetical protein
MRLRSLFIEVLLPLTIAVALIPATLLAQGKLEITSPAAGTIVNPGERIVVKVSVSGGPFSSVSILAPGTPIGSNALTAPPYQVSYAIPSEITPHLDRISAIGSTASGVVFSAPVWIDLERPDSPTSIATNLSQIELQVGHIASLSVTGAYADGSVVLLTESTHTKYEPSTAGVVLVQADGLVTAVATGTATIEVRHKDKRAIVKVTVIPKRN